MTKFTPKPLPVPLAMSTAAPDQDQSSLSKHPAPTNSVFSGGPSIQTPSPLPLRPKSAATPESDDDDAQRELGQHVLRPHPKIPFPTPKLRIHCQDLRHPGARAFFQTIDPSNYLDEAVNIVLSILYGGNQPNGLIPPTRSVTLVLQSDGGVAQTGGIDLDNDHKEILFSLDYIGHKAKSDQLEGVGREIKGVLVHEMVHAWQWDGKGRAPGGLIEGIADFVRLKAELSPPHWKKESPEKWDAGYQTTAYFLEWLENTKAAGSVKRINEALKDEYRETVFWKALFEQDVGKLFDEYKDSFGNPKSTATVE